MLRFSHTKIAPFREFSEQGLVVLSYSGFSFLGASVLLK